MKDRNMRIFGGKGIRKVLSTSVLMILVLSSGVGALELPVLPDNLSSDDLILVAGGLDEFEKARVGLWSGIATEESIAAYLDAAEALFLNLNDPAVRDYLLARVILYRGRAELTWGNRGDARDYFEQAMDLAADSSTFRESSEALRVQADAGSSWMITKGLGGIIKMAPQVQQWSDRSLELNPSNSLALIINAQGQINAPRSAGGDPAEAVRRLELLVGRNDLDDIELFWGRVSLAQALDKLKERDRAADWCEQAADIFPESPMLEDCP